MTGRQLTVGEVHGQPQLSKWDEAAAMQIDLPTENDDKKHTAWTVREMNNMELFYTLDE